MSELTDHDLEIDGYRIGKAYPIFAESVDPGTPEHRVQDVDNPLGDSQFFGRDYVSGTSWTLALTSNTSDAQSALAAMAELSKRWNNPAKRHTPGAVSELKYSVGGRVRKVYGRPRKFSIQPTGAGLNSGVLKAQAEFVTADPLYYMDEAFTLSLSYAPGVRRGLIAPIVAPIILNSGAGQRQGQILVGGDAETPFTVRVHGPITNPKVRSDSGGWELEVKTSLAYDQHLTIDTRTHTVRRSDGASMAGFLTRKSRLTARLRPGAQEIIFSGNDPTATSRATVSWNEAYSTF